LRNAVQRLVEEGSLPEARLNELVAGMTESDDSPHTVVAHCRMHQLIAKFKSCIDSAKFRQDVQSDYQEEIRVGFAGTPTFFIMVSPSAARLLMSSSNKPSSASWQKRGTARAYSRTFKKLTDRNRNRSQSSMYSIRDFVSQVCCCLKRFDLFIAGGPSRLFQTPESHSSTLTPGLRLSFSSASFFLA